MLRFFLQNSLILVGLTLCLSAMKVNTVCFQIEPGSTLQVKGSSNVTDFSCECGELFPKLPMQMSPTGDGYKARFFKTSLQIRTRKLDCGSKPMNNDMYQTLKADDYPHIQIELLETGWKSGGVFQKADQWQSLEAVVNITIAGVTRKETLTVQGKKLNDDQYRFKSAKLLLMTDFGIKPPRPLLGLIKVANEITIELDLVVSLQRQI